MTRHPDPDGATLTVRPGAGKSNLLTLAASRAVFNVCTDSIARDRIRSSLASIMAPAISVSRMRWSVYLMRKAANCVRNATVLATTRVYRKVPRAVSLTIRMRSCRAESCPTSTPDANVHFLRWDASDVRERAWPSRIVRHFADRGPIRVSRYGPEPLDVPARTITRRDKDGPAPTVSAGPWDFPACFYWPGRRTLRRSFMSAAKRISAFGGGTKRS